jgi:hypothetical protein
MFPHTEGHILQCELTKYVLQCPFASAVEDITIESAREDVDTRRGTVHRM